uniref:Complement C1q-like protein 2 n=1 Tax=Magallana gigas TaxID=29159 RepID=K1RN94_MAGGI
MMSYIILGFLCVIPSICLSILTDGETQNGTLRDESVDTETDVFRQLLNQETLIRMSLVKNVHSLMKDMIEMKESMSASNKRLHDAEKEISSLKNEVQLLKTENQKFKEQAVKFQDEFRTTDSMFNEIEGNFTKVSQSQTQYERHVNDKIEDFEKNTSTILNDIKIEVRYLSVTLLDLNKHTMELNMSIPELIESRITDFTANVNRSVDNLNNTINSIKADVEQSQKSQLKLSAAVSSLEVFRMNMSLLNNCVSKTSVSFTVGLTSSSSSWNGNILVFPHVVTNNGNGYNPSTGKFTAPTDGTYVFFVTVNTYGSNYIYLDIVLNGLQKVRTMSHNSANYMTGTNMAVLQLYTGNSVWVSRSSGQSYYTDSVPITTFSGFLL